MKRIALAALVLGALAALAFVRYPNEFNQFVGTTRTTTEWAWENVKANPAPVSIALGTFLLTVVYHKAKGKSLRESVEAAATRVTVVNVPASEVETPVVKRARARATRAQLLSDQIGIQNRQRKLPEEVQKAERDACYTEQGVADAERKLAEKRKFHDEAVTKLATLRNERSSGEAELSEIENELRKLAEVA